MAIYGTTSGIDICYFCCLKSRPLATIGIVRVRSWTLLTSRPAGSVSARCRPLFSTFWNFKSLSAGFFIVPNLDWRKLPPSPVQLANVANVSHVATVHSHCRLGKCLPRWTVARVGSVATSNVHPSNLYAVFLQVT